MADGPSGDAPGDRRELGPRGGRTTRKRGQVKKTVWLYEEEAEHLRKAAYESYRSEASLIREALRRYFDLEE